MAQGYSRNRLAVRIGRILLGLSAVAAVAPAGTGAGAATDTTVGSRSAPAVDPDAGPGLEVTILAAPESVPETGAPVVFDLSIDNVGPGAVELKRINDDVFGNLNGDGTCRVGVLVKPGATYQCTFTATVNGQPGDEHIDTLTVDALDVQSGRSVSAQAQATVAVVDLEPSLTVIRTPSQRTVFAPGEEVKQRLKIINTSAGTDPVTITSLVDAVHGDVSSLGDCTVPRVLAPDGIWFCTYTALVEVSETDSPLSVAGVDDDGTPVAVDAPVTIELVDPALALSVLVAGELAVDAPGPYVPVGEPVQWTYEVANVGTAPMTAIKVADEKRGVIRCPASELAPGDTMVCTGSGPAVAGQFATTATVSGSYTDADKDQVKRRATAAAHYFGSRAALTVVHGPDYQAVPAGEAATFTVTVTNSGNVDLADVAVVDPGAPDCERSFGLVAAGATETYECTLASVDGSTVSKVTATAVGPAGDEAMAEAEVRVLTPVGQIAGVEVACGDFLAGRSIGLDSVRYHLGPFGKITSILPGVFAYRAVVTVGEDQPVVVAQDDDGSTPPFAVYQMSQAALWHTDCTRALTGSVSREDSTVTFTPPKAGTYVVAITYSTDAAKTSIDPGPVTYNFTTSVGGAVIESTGASISLRPKG